MLQGEFDNAAQSDAPIKTAIDKAAKDVNFVIRPIARSRLTKTNPVITKVKVDRDGRLIVIKLNTGLPTRTEPGQSPVKWTRDDGEVFDVSTTWQGATLVQTFASADGRRENRYSVSTEGAVLTLHVTLFSEQLKTPVQYILSFRRRSP